MMGVKIDPEHAAKRDGWLQRFDAALTEYADAKTMLMMIALSKSIPVKVTDKDGKVRRIKKNEPPPVVSFFGMKFGSSREDAVARLAELGFAPEPTKRRSKKKLIASAEGEPVKFDLEFRADELVGLTFRFSYPPRTHALKTGDLEKMVYKRMGGGSPMACGKMARDRGIRGIWKAQWGISDTYASMWREHDKEAKVYTICFDVRDVDAEKPRSSRTF